MEAGNDFPSNIVDTTHDYMELIYQFVIETNKPKKNIFQIIRDDFEEFVNSPEFIDNEDDYDFASDCIFDWTITYPKKLTIDKKNELYNMYGVQNLLLKVTKIADNHCYDTFEAFVEDDFHESLIISHIIQNKAINDILKEKCPYYTVSDA